jgi:hypothetical protein
MLLLALMGLFFACNVCFVVYVLVRTPKLKEPLTSPETLRAAPRFNSNAIRHPRLTSRGKVLVLGAVAFGAVAAFVSLALVSRIAASGLSGPALPALVMVLLLDLVPIGFVAYLHRTYRLVLAGRFATGVVVAANVGGITSWGLFYDFLDGSGQVIRGNSSRRFYTVALARCFYGRAEGSDFGVGSYVPVLFRAGEPSRNAPYVSFPWEI